MKTKEWLRSRLEDGDILNAEVLSELLESYWHKNETGQVSDGDGRPVVGGQVAEAMKGLRDELLEVMGKMIEDYMAKHLPELLKEYITQEALSQVLEARDRYLKNWVTERLSTLAKNEEVDERLRKRTDDILVEVDKRLDPYPKTVDLSDLLGMDKYARIESLPSLLEIEKYALKTALPDMAGYVLKVDFNEAREALNEQIGLRVKSVDVPTEAAWTTFRQQIQASLDSKADKVYVDEKSDQAKAAAISDASDKYALKASFNDDGLYLKTIVTP
ncbi:MAG: hypothetical protein J6I49_03625 [Bacteroidales bacterium]|nr:hypothetical protein [Bacteroidales bacterium]